MAAEDRFGIEASCWVYPRPFKQDISVVASITSTLVICLVSFVCVSVVGFFVLLFLHDFVESPTQNLLCVGIYDVVVGNSGAILFPRTSSPPHGLCVGLREEKVDNH